MSEILTRKELMRRLKVGKDKVTKWTEEGMPYFRTAEGSRGHLRFVWEDVLEWLRGEVVEVVEEEEK